jgi:hypothetical protein
MLMRRFIDNQCSKSDADLLIRLMASKEKRHHFGRLVEESLNMDDINAAQVNDKRIEENFSELESRLSKHRIFKTPQIRHWLMGNMRNSKIFS